MSYKSVYEPEAKVMDDAEVCEDAQQIANVLRLNLLKAESVIQLQITNRLYQPKQILYQATHSLLHQLSENSIPTN